MQDYVFDGEFQREQHEKAEMNGVRKEIILTILNQLYLVKVENYRTKSKRKR